MALIDLIFSTGESQSSIGSMQLDALVSEETVLQADVTSYAVEDGTEISDNITVLPETLSLSGVVTAADALIFSAGGKSKLINSKALLRQIHKDRQPITIVTGLDMYQDYAMTVATIRRSNDGAKLDIDAQFKKINKVGLERSEIPLSQVSDDTPEHEQTQQRSGKTAQRAGSVNQDPAEGVDPTDEVKDSKPDSWLLRGSQAIGGLFG